MNFYVVSFGYEFIHHQNIDARTKVNSKTYSAMVKPKAALPRATSFNEIVTLDMKQYGNKYVLWCIDVFT